MSDFPLPNGNGKRSLLQVSRLFVRSGVTSVLSHWLLACFSLVAAFGIWFVVQDVENPQVDVFVPAQSAAPSIVVSAVNAGNFIVSELSPVRVQVQARKADAASLRPTDFDATVDVKNVQPGVPTDVPVHVTSQRSGVRIIAVQPATVTVTLEQAKVKTFPVTVRRVAALPPGYQESNQPTIDPAFVTIRGLPQLVDSVTEVDVDLNLSGIRGDTQIEGTLVARTAAGNPVTVTLSPTSARVSLTVTQIFEQRTLGVTPAIVGSPAPGYRVANVTIDPPTVTVTGPKSVVDGLQGLGTEQLDIGGATKDIILSRQVDKVPNLVSDHTSVIITVSIVPVTCSANQTAAPCGEATFVVAPDLRPPTGLAVAAGGYSVTVQVSGPLNQVLGLKSSDIKASVDLTGARAGTASYPVTVSVPSGIKAAPVAALSLTLKAVP